MKIKNFGFTVLFGMSFLAFAVFAQGQSQVQQQEQTSSVVENTASEPEAQESKKESVLKPRNPRANYLDVFHANENAPKFRKENQVLISALRIIISNFGTPEEQSSLDSILRDFKKGVTQLYKGRVIDSERLFKKNKKEMKDIFERIAIRYETRTSDLLDRCADALVEMEIAEFSAEPGNELYSKAEVIHRNKAKLNVAYTQLIEAQGMLRIDRHKLAIGHYRVAKHYGISILQDLSEDEEGKNKVAREFSVDTEDIKNLIAKKK